MTRMIWKDMFGILKEYIEYLARECVYLSSKPRKL